MSWRYVQAISAGANDLSSTLPNAENSSNVTTPTRLANEVIRRTIMLAEEAAKKTMKDEESEEEETITHIQTMVDPCTIEVAEEATVKIVEKGEQLAPTSADEVVDTENAKSTHMKTEIDADKCSAAAAAADDTRCVLLEVDAAADAAADLDTPKESLERTESTGSSTAGGKKGRGKGKGGKRGGKGRK